jgi:hypothetical protein
MSRAFCIIALVVSPVPALAQDAGAVPEVSPTVTAAPGAPTQTEEIEEVEAVEPVVERFGTNYPQADRILNTYTARPARKGSFIINIDHRANEAITKDPWFDYVGLDGGSLKIGLGLRYGVLDDLDVGIFRLNGTAETFDTYELDARYRLLDQERFGVNAAARGGLSWFSQKAHKDASGFLGELVVDRVLLDRVVVGAGTLFHSSSSSDKKKSSDKHYSAAALGYVELRVLPSMALTGELSANVLGYHLRYPSFAAGIKGFTNRHTFSLLVTNSQYIGSDGLVANAWRGKLDQLIVGFKITREI